jgi:uncharacterized membrane protein HdeD (DUF308 family)
MNSQSSTNIFKEAAGASIGWGVVMILLGIAAMLLPLATGIGVSVAFGWIIVLSGIAYIASAFAARGAGSFLWRLLIGIVYVLGGFFLAFHPGLALESLTLAMALMFFFEGIMEIVVFFQFRALGGSGWVLADGIVTLFLAYLIWRPWPGSSVWAIGTILGVNLIVSGITRLMYSMSARRVLDAVS